MSKTCVHCQTKFHISREESALRLEISPKISGRQFLLPEPSLCPNCRHLRRLAWRNERRLYRNTCVITGKPIVSSYSPDKELRVCQRSAWLDFDNRQFGRPYDFSRTFFDQFQELNNLTYKPNVSQAGEIINSDYTHSVGWLKNCYLIFDSGKSEDCAYGSFVAYAKNCFDNSFAFYSELCFDCVKIENCYALIASDYCKSCSYSAYLLDCIGCKNCIGSVNLRNQEYYLFNQPVGKGRFKEAWDYYFCGKHSRLMELEVKVLALRKQVPRRASYVLDSFDSTGDTLVKCQNVRDSFEVLEAKDSAHLFDIFKYTEKCCDVTGFGEGMEFVYESTQCGGTFGKSAVSNIFFSSHIFYGGYNIFYSSNCHENSQNLFGCADLRKSEYCILNQQYSKQDFERLLPKVLEHLQATGEWGEFFPYWLSPYGYNESLAMEECPLTEDETRRIGANWTNYVPPIPLSKGSVLASELPDSILEISDEILNTVILCQESKRPFKLLPQEFKFLQQMNLPPPQKHPEIRERDRRKRKHGRRLFVKECAKCGKSVDSVFSTHEEGLDYCQGCYESEVY